MKTQMAFLAVLLVIVIKGQAQSKLEVSQGLGHETNVFKNPAFYTRGSTEMERADMYQNGFYSYSRLDFSSVYARDFFYLKMKAQGSTQQFLALEDAHSYRLNAALDLRFKLGVNRYLHLAPNYSMYRQNGIDQGQGAIRTPLSYSSLLLPLMFERRRKGSKRYSGIYYRFKNYPAPAEDQLFYHSVGAQWNREKRFERAKEGYLSKLELEASFRHYTDISVSFPPGFNFEDDEWEDDFNERVQTRNWAYAQVAYRIRRYTESGYVEIPVRSFLRADFSTRKYGYLQNDLGLNVLTHLGRSRLSVKTKLAHRHHFRLKTSDSVSIRYFYAGLDVKWVCPITQKLDLFAEVEMIRRFSNNHKVSSLAFREYFNVEAQLGLTYRLF